ncbi:MAG: spermidine/putrescine ABC transporter substrate-binding protein [Oscillospiraceae bacterium]|nr:spermidine/putrescine ABC transporter substrate-binding protein [Oscillospiraceae bacterium]
MKKMICLVLSIGLLLGLAGCGRGGNSGETVTLNVFNWGEYMDNEYFLVNKKFTEETGIKINYQTYETNEAMYGKLSAGGADYDVVFPSDYMVGKMISEGMLAKLDFSNIPNYALIDDLYKNLDYDPQNEYSVPYTWGTVGIFYNTKFVDEEDLELGWDLLWAEQYKQKIAMFNNQRDAFSVALLKLGKSLNTTVESDWQAAFEALREQKPLVYAYYNDQVYEALINENIWIAPYYSGDILIICDEDEGNPDIEFFAPESGTSMFVDAVCVMENSKHKKEAEMYIDFLCRTDVAKANAEYLGYSTPQKEAREQLGPEIGQNPNFYPPKEFLEKTEPMLTLPAAINELMDSLWIELKK